MSYDACAVANALLNIADENKIPLTHMALQKVIFYAHGWYLIKYDQPLVRQPFEAWEYGPVLRCLWDSFKNSGKGVVKNRATRLDLLKGERVFVEPDILEVDVLFLRGILNAYGHLHAYELSRMTYAPGGPWDVVFQESKVRVNLGMKISNDEIRKHFHNVTVAGSARA